MKARVLSAVRAFDSFDDENDPHHEHDCFSDLEASG